VAALFRATLILMVLMENHVSAVLGAHRCQFHPQILTSGKLRVLTGLSRAEQTEHGLSKTLNKAGKLPSGGSGWGLYRRA
jgi:hypothetical protein